MDLTNVSNSSVIMIDPNQTTFLFKTALQFIIPGIIGGLIAIYSSKKAFEYNRKLEGQRNEFIMEQERRELHNHLVERRKDAHKELIQRRQRAYSQLIGRKSMLLQSHASYYSTFIREQLLDCRSIVDMVYQRLGGKDPEVIELERQDSIELKEGLRAKQRGEDLQLVLGKSSERLWETIGLIQTIYPNSTEIDETIEKIKIKEDDFELLEGRIRNTSREFERAVFDEAKQMGDPLPEQSITSWAKNKLDDLDPLFSELEENLISNINEFESIIDELLGLMKKKMRNVES